jgi:hypothetical protein
MAKKTSRGGKRILSLIFHLVVLVSMVIAYDRVRAVFAERKTGQAPLPKNTQTDGKQKNTKDKVAPRGTSMEDLMSAKKKKELEKAKPETDK